MMRGVMTSKTVPSTNRDRQPSSHSLPYLWCPSPLRVPRPEAVKLATGKQGPPPLRGWPLASRCMTPTLERKNPPDRKPSFDAGESPLPSVSSATTDNPTPGGASRIGVDTARTPAAAKAPCHRRCRRRHDDAQSVLTDRTLFSKDSKFQDSSHESVRGSFSWLRPLATAGSGIQEYSQLLRIGVPRLEALHRSVSRGSRRRHHL